MSDRRERQEGKWPDRFRRAVAAALPPLRVDPRLYGVAAVSALALVAAALVYPDTPAGALATVALIASAGAALAVGARGPRWLGVAVAHAIVLYVGWRLLGGLWHDGIGWNGRDWGPLHARVADLIRIIERGAEPGWVHGVSSGDAPYELYPSLTTHLAAWSAMLFDLTDDVPLVLTRLAIVVHLAIAVAAVRLSLRVGPWPVAALVGVVALFDRGAHAGGANTLFHWGLLHSGVATALWLFALVAVVDAIRRPRLATSLQIWIFGGLAIAAHPLGLVACGLTALALVVVALLARDVPARRPGAALFHVLLALLLAAGVWMPLTARLLEYGTGYGTAPAPHMVFLAELLRGDWPPSSFAAIMGAGLAGIVIGALSRRAIPTLLGALVTGAALGFSGQIYTALDLGASPELARFSHLRLMSLARVPILAGVGVVAALALGRRAGNARGRAMLGAVIAVMTIWGLRGALPLADRDAELIRKDADSRVEHPEGLEALARWATERSAEASPERFGRLMFETPANYVYHVHAVSGLPTLWVGAVSAYLLRERIGAATPAQLRRFGIRWVVREGNPPARGEPESEVVVGGYHIRELKAWDGQFARIERGAGQVRVTRLDDEAVVIELSGTDRPALVALGTGYYPRWRASSGGRALPVYALPATPKSELSVVAAWVPPGSTTFSPDGPLPSDGRGRWLSRLAALLALAITIVWTVPRWRRRALRAMARGHLRLRDHWGRSRRPLLFAGVPLAAGLLLFAAATGARSPVTALAVGDGLRGGARVEARLPGDPWRRCAYHRLRGTYRCADLAEIGDGMGQVLEPPAPSWRLVTPVIRVRRDPAVEGTVEFRIRLSAALEGRYRARVRDGAATVVLDDRPAKDLRDERAFDLEDGTHEVILEGSVGGRWVDLAFVRADAVEPERDYPRPPTEPLQ